MSVEGGMGKGRLSREEEVMMCSGEEWRRRGVSHTGKRTCQVEERAEGLPRGRGDGVDD